jgi:hypothetical protein
VAGECEFQLIGRDAAAVVNHADQLDPALLYRDVDAPRSGVERILDKFLDHARRPLDHLAGRDLIDDGRRQLADDGHR